jgi:transketolase
MISAVHEPPAGSSAWIQQHGLSAVDTCRLAQLHAADRDERVFSLEGDLGDFGGLAFQDRHPTRSLDLGIAEANMVGVAAGLAMRGKVPFVNTFGSFALMRACEQVRLDVAYHRSNVKIAGTFTGIAAAFSGPTHHCGEDLTIARVLPGMTVLAPADAVSAYQLTLAAAEWDGPVYIRLGLDETPQVYDETAHLEIGRGAVLRDGDDVAIVAAGLTTVASAVTAADQLAERGVRARVLDMYTIKPIDRELLVSAARATGLVVTVEEHSILGGLGSAVAEVLAEELPVPVRMLGLPDEFAHELCGYPEHLSRCGLDADGICRAVEQSIRRWK